MFVLVNGDYCSSTLTRWLTLRTIPKIWGVASCSTGLCKFLDTERLKRQLLALWAVDGAAHLGDLDLGHGAYPLNTRLTGIPRRSATSDALRIMVSALKVAFTTFCVFEEPKDLARTSLMPALSRYSAHGASSDHTRTWSGWLHQAHVLRQIPLLERGERFR